MVATVMIELVTCEFMPACRQPSDNLGTRRINQYDVIGELTGAYTRCPERRFRAAISDAQALCLGRRVRRIHSEPAVLPSARRQRASGADLIAVMAPRNNAQCGGCAAGLLLLSDWPVAAGVEGLPPIKREKMASISDRVRGNG